MNGHSSAQRRARALGELFRRHPSSHKPIQPDRELICAACGAVFPEYLARCPECGSEEWKGLVEVNPYTRLPMEQFLKFCGHGLWIFGTLGCLMLFWQTGGENSEMDEVYIFLGIILLLSGVLFSAAYFGLSELLRRLLRVQRRLRAFHEAYREKHNGRWKKTRRSL